jgi:hypothetical protein
MLSGITVSVYAESQDARQLFSETQSNVSPNDTQSQKAQSMQEDYNKFKMVSDQNRFILLIVMILVTPIFLYIVLYFMKNSAQFNSEHVVHASALVLLIQGTAFIVVASLTTEQLTAAIGVMGAIAGYLFGTATKTKKTETASEKQKS